MSQYYFFKLIPPRPTFPFDMSEQEKEIMNRHVAYWTDLMQKRTVVVFGPVLDPNGTYGIGVLELPEGQDPQSFADNDPAIKAEAGFAMQLFAMPQVMVRE